jgi:NADH:ubiquinone oxidoreductase subunit 5 (subunit L)/multisubunit Na+/H+ antiporter MnhA subunit
MFTDLHILLPALIVMPASLALIAAALVGRPGGRGIVASGALVASLGFVMAVVLAVHGSRGTAVEAAVGGLAIAVDRLAAVLLLLVFGVSAVVQVFAIRYLAGDPRGAWFTAGASLLTCASAGLVTAVTFPGIALSWTVGGIAICLLLGMYWELPAARDGVRRTAIAFLLGDLALWAAAVMVTARWGAVDVRTLLPGKLDEPLVPVIAVLVVVAALSRSGQIPFHRWLPATMAAPTPVSALLHAGVVNAGGILLVRLAPLVSGEPARALTVLAGAATLTYGAVIMLVKPDVKGALVNSTMAQMGFMILTCGLGLWVATIFHLVAHGFYKAALFLSSGSAIAQQRRAAARPSVAPLSQRRRVFVGAAAVVLPVLALYAAAHMIALPAVEHNGERALLIFAWATGAAATWGWLTRRRGITAVLVSMAVLFPTAVGYLGLTAAVANFLAPALPAVAPVAATSWLVVAALSALLGVLAVLRWMPHTALHRTVYSRALSAGYLPSSLPANLTGARS